MNLISVPSQLFEEAVVVLSMDVRSVRSGTVDGLHDDVSSPPSACRPPKANRPTSLCLRFADVYVLNRAMRNERHRFKGLRRWLASGSTIAIPANLAPLANMIVAFADADPAASEEFAALIVDPERRAQASTPELLSRLSEYHFRLTATLDLPPDTVIEWINNPDASVYVRVGPGNAGRLPFAADLFLSVMELIERSGGGASNTQRSARQVAFRR
jgi:hypothetical protein